MPTPNELIKLDQLEHDLNVQEKALNALYPEAAEYHRNNQSLADIQLDQDTPYMKQLTKINQGRGAINRMREGKRDLGQRLTDIGKINQCVQGVKKHIDEKRAPVMAKGIGPLGANAIIGKLAGANPNVNPKVTSMQELMKQKIKDANTKPLLNATTKPKNK